METEEAATKRLVGVFLICLVLWVRRIYTWRFLLVWAVYNSTRRLTPDMTGTVLLRDEVL
eukprot:31898-Eustigmatos_ZCMA.PRE.1